MSDRLTVVFEDPELYRRLKVFAAERRLSMKYVIQAAIEDYLNGLSREDAREPDAVDWDAFWEWQKRIEALDDDVPGSEPVMAGVRAVAEEQAPYRA